MIDEVNAEGFDGLDGMLASEGVHGIFHRVGGENFLVVALGVRGLEIALKRDGQSDFLDVVAAFLSHDA